jgi:hypothetical protein
MNTSECLNLEALFGERFKITWDESRESNRDRDPWMMQIPCRGRGLMNYPHGGDLLALQCDSRPNIAAMIRRIPGVKLDQDGESEKTFIFAIGVFEQVAAIVKPRRKRQWTEEERQAVAEHLRPFQFGPCKE